LKKITSTFNSKPKLLDQVKLKLQSERYSKKTIEEIKYDTTMIYTHVANMGAEVKSPLDE